MTEPRPQADPAPITRSPSNPPAQLRAVRSEDLLQGSRELLILHGGETYRLLRTRNDKLILQK